jgi:hypothetical protein
MDSSICSAALCLITCLLISAGSRGAVSQRGTLVAKWRTELRVAVGSEPLPRIFAGKIEFKSSQPITSLWFTDNNTIVATFLTRKG